MNKKLTIKGQETVDRDEIVIQVAATGTDGLAINATDVTIRHLKVDGPAVATDDGIVGQCRDATIDDVEVTDWCTGIVMLLGPTISSSRTATSTPTSRTA